MSRQAVPFLRNHEAGHWRVRVLTVIVMATILIVVPLLEACGSSNGSTPTPPSGQSASPEVTATKIAATTGTPTPASLPQTASASGLRITLVSGTRSGNQVVLTFKIESAEPNQPNMWAVGGGGELMGIIGNENDVVGTGLRWDEQNQGAQSISFLAPPGANPLPRALSPTPQPTPDVTGYLETLPFVLTGSVDQPVTVTIRRVRFNNVPSTRPPGNVISGTWSFAFVPASLPAPTPAPNGSATP